MTSPFPDWLQPMAATLTEERFTGSDWIFERKYDGIRLLAFKHGDDVRLLSRNRLPLNGSYPAVVRAIAALPVDDVILDGESTAGWEQAATLTTTSSTSCGSTAVISRRCRSKSGGAARRVFPSSFLSSASRG